MQSELSPLSPGQRLLVTGKTGSGKTRGMIWFAARQSLPVIILDTKNEEAFETLPHALIVDGLDLDFENIYKEQVPAFVVVRPSIAENDSEALDGFLLRCYEELTQVCIMIDELYSVAENSYPAPGLKAILTRGRSRRLTLISGSQRPAWIPLFCFSEADAFAVYRLSLEQDRQRLVNITGEAALKEPLDNFEFWWYTYALQAPVRHAAVPLLRMQEASPEIRRDTFRFK